MWRSANQSTGRDNVPGRADLNLLDTFDVDRGHMFYRNHEMFPIKHDPI
jgi:hypothetical protein